MSATSADTSRPRPAETKKVHIADTTMTLQNWYKHVNWLNITFIVGIPVYGCIQALWVPLQLKTAVWAIIYYFFTGLGITAGKLLAWMNRCWIQVAD
jgi:stearoyl-CoA desaturase (delta-9 desaturase)